MGEELLEAMLEEIKNRCGILPAVTVYDDEIQGLIEDAVEDMELSGVPLSMIEKRKPGVLTAVTLYVKAYWGNDRSDTNRYINLYRQKVFRLTLSGEEVSNVE